MERSDTGGPHDHPLLGFWQDTCIQGVNQILGGEPTLAQCTTKPLEYEPTRERGPDARNIILATARHSWPLLCKGRQIRPCKIRCPIARSNAGETPALPGGGARPRACCCEQAPVHGLCIARGAESASGDRSSTGSETDGRQPLWSKRHRTARFHGKRTLGGSPVASGDSTWRPREVVPS